MAKDPEKLSSTVEHDGRRYTLWTPVVIGNEKTITNSSDVVLKKLSSLILSDDGLEFYEFRIGSYHALTDDIYRTPYNDNAMAVVVLSTPSFFDTTFMRWLRSKKAPNESLNEFAERFDSNPIRNYFVEKLKQVEEELKPLRVDVIHDFDFLPNCKPKFLMTVCGHVAGAAYFYRPIEFSWHKGSTERLQRRMGLSLHPKYGGHFAFRAVLVFPNIQMPTDFVERKPAMVLDTIQKQMHAIDLFNDHWKDGRFRDCGDPVETYSQLQIQYFNLPPSDRWSLISDWFDKQPEDGAVHD